MPRFLTGLAGLVLLATAALHASGYASVSDSIRCSGASPFVERVVPSLWLFFSWHLSALALACFWATARADRAARPLVWFVAGVVTVDLVWLLRTVGVFPGSVLLGLTALCSLAAAATWKAQS